MIITLLLSACAVSILLLSYTSDLPTGHLDSYSEADSLLKNNFELFNIARKQVSERTLELDSNYIRREYYVDVPPGFSKTQLHQEIHQTFYPYGVETPARVVFPEKDVVIHLLYDETVFGSVYLRTDSELVLQRNFASILVAFESVPSDELLEQIKSLGEPIPLVFIVNSAERAGQIRQKVRDRYPNMLFWVEDPESTGKSYTDSFSYPQLQLLQKAVPDAEILSFDDGEGAAGSQHKEPNTLAKASLPFVDVSEAILLHESLQKTAFQRELQKFSLRARRGEHPVAILMANEEMLGWLGDELADFKKSGLHIVPPVKKRLFDDD